MNRLLRRMALLSVAVFITFVVGANACAAEKAAKLIPARIAVVSRSTLDLPFWVAREQGFFREEGIDGEIILFRASLAVQAMIGGSVDFGTATGTALSAAVNGADGSFMSLRAGVVDAVMLQIPATFLAQDEGFRKIAVGADYYRAVQGGLAATKTFLAEKPEVATKVIRATLRALRLLKNDKKYAIEALTKKNYVELGKERERFAERAYEAAMQGYSLTGVVDEKLQREMITVAAQRVKSLPQLAPERIFDFSFARKASEGLR
jgi:ABC-type nitrate/sulfonate/bicarbonate transport system substrate-binding protein